MSKKLIMAAANAAAATQETVLVPLRSWVEGGNADNSHLNEHQIKESLIQKTTIAYGIVELLLLCPDNNVALDDEAMIQVDNFSVLVSKHLQQDQHQKSPPWHEIRGVAMLSSGLSLSIEEPSYLSCLFDEGGEKDGRMGRYLEVELDAEGVRRDRLDDTKGKEEIITNKQHYLVARILYELYTQEKFHDDDEEPAHKKTKKAPLVARGHSNEDANKSALDIFTIPAVRRMHQLKAPSSVCRMIQNLLEKGGDAYKTLKEVGDDLHLLLFDPDRFLFDHETQSTDSMNLFYTKGKLYGREKEETLITDAFCRVTRGKSEAFFISGFSGSGKSMLVDTLRKRVHYVGGYVVKHKYDAISQERPLSGVVSAVNQLCLMMKRGLTSERLATLSKQLKNDFGADIGLLARMLPSVCALSPEFGIHAGKDGDEYTSDKMNDRSVSFTLLRFIRLVSSPKRPIMLFLDDLQWADDAVFDIIHTFLSDKMGTCMFFVGAYRDNEVKADHKIFDLVEKLEISSVSTSKIDLDGLDQQDVNKMISDELCLYPRICKSLSDIVFQKTKGNPFFVLEFMQSLRSRGLLQYDSCLKRWLWNNDAIRAEDITDNVLHLLSSKMNGLSCDMQLLLKIMACFGTYTNEWVIICLSKSPEYAGVIKELEGVINEGFVEVSGDGKLKFVHDKIREAAYNLIPVGERDKLHYNLGKTMYSLCQNEDAGEGVFLIASQINHGKELIEKDDELRIPVTKLNMKAGKKALDGCDHKTAYFYFIAALSLLPDDNWDSYYDLSLRLNFLMSRASFSSCKYHEAEVVLQTICERARCLHDKLPAYALLTEIYLAQGRPNKAYTTCASILVRLGETVPESVTPESAGDLISQTLKMYSAVYSSDWLRNEIEDTTLCNIIKFYSMIATAAFFCKPSQMGAHFVCKMVQLSFQHGTCRHTALAFMQLSSIVFKIDNAPLVYCIAKNAISLSEKCGSSEEMTELCVNYYMGAGHLDSYQLGAKELRKGFASGLSFGNVNTAFYCAAQGAYFSMISAEIDLLTLLKEIDYYLHLLETYKSEMTKKYILCIRETVSTMIDRGEATGIDAQLDQIDYSDPGNLLEMLYVHQVFRNYWLGYAERCHYYVQKCFTVCKSGKFNIYTIKFYHGLNSLDMLKKKTNFTKSSEVDEIIASIRVAALHADSNFRNKLELLEAEQFGIATNHNQAVAYHAYDTAIASAQSAQFIHEQGLACEKAGFYSKRMNNTSKSLHYFTQARECYEKWGSTVKVEFIQRELDRIL